MESALTKILAIATVVSLAAVFAPVINKFRNFPAARCALLSAALPWSTLAMLFHLPTFRTLALFSLVLIASAFLFAIFFYAAEEPSARRATALAAISVATCAAIYFAVLIGYPLLIFGI